MTRRDIGASVRQRLLNQAHQQDRPFQEVLQFYAMERFLYRLSRSPFADQFVLKGALLLAAWKAPQARPTMDIDLAGRANNSLDHIAQLMAAICAELCEEDGIEFLADTIETSRIKEDAASEQEQALRLFRVYADERVDDARVHAGYGVYLCKANHHPEGA